jgi:hypothetical protein
MTSQKSAPVIHKQPTHVTGLKNYDDYKKKKHPPQQRDNARQ